MMHANIPEHLRGLTADELRSSRERFGYNKAESFKEDSWLTMLLDILKEPMLLLLIAVTILYLMIGDYGEAIFMFAAILAVSGISFYQDNRSKRALQALEQLNEPLSKVIRDGQVQEIPSFEIAVGDLCIVEEGKMINADGRILHSNDFSVNESSLTGERFSIFKNRDSEDNRVYSGTIVVSGLAVFEVEFFGKETRLGQIGSAVLHMEEEKSPLQMQISSFVKKMAILGISVFAMVWVFSYYMSGGLIESLLNGLTMAMSVLPEEIPVAFTTFMALGAWKLMQDGLIIKRSNIVETLGSTTVICADKTGTITKNIMQLHYIYDKKSGHIAAASQLKEHTYAELIEYAMWSSEPVPFDPLEKTIHEVYASTQTTDLSKTYVMCHEYPLDGQPPMMTHIYEDEQKHRIIAAKGAAEAIMDVSILTSTEKSAIRKVIEEFGIKGYRILGVGKAIWNGPNFPKRQQDFQFEFLGLLMFYDPPKDGINEVFRQIADAGINLKIITGDHGGTTKAIAEQAGILVDNPIVNGYEIADMEEGELQTLVKKTTIFARMYPERKLAVVRALKKNGEVVAMLGDGVNDAPALKAAHIGVAMGHKGTEIAKAAADLVITNDNLDNLIIGIAAGRRIYTNIKKAIQYIISIHIPIILTVALPLFLGWPYPLIFTPVHVIFLELVMGPTCSIAYESEPIEKNLMQKPPRIMADTFLNQKELTISIVQGLMITLGVLFAYQWTVNIGGTEEETRAMVFTTLIFANVILSLVNRSFYYSILDSLKNKNPLLISINVLAFLAVFVILYIPTVADFFQVKPLEIGHIGFALLIASISVLWFEVFKLYKRNKKDIH